MNYKKGEILMSKSRFIMRWPELGKEVRVESIDHNQQIFNWFLSNLPTKCLQTITVVAGLSLFMLNLPMNKERCNWIQEDSPLEDIVQMPKGRFTFFMTSGNVANLSCKFDRVTEPMSYVTWAEVIEEDKNILEEVGNQIWENTMMEKKPIYVEFVGMEG